MEAFYEVKWVEKTEEGGYKDFKKENLTNGEVSELLPSLLIDDTIKFVVNILPVVYRLKDYKELTHNKLYSLNGVLVKFDGENLLVALTTGSWNYITSNEEWYMINEDTVMKEVL